MAIEIIRMCTHNVCDECEMGKLCCLDCSLFGKGLCGQICMNAQYVHVGEKDECEHSIDIITESEEDNG